VGTGSSDLDDWMKPLRFGSREAHHRINLSTERVYVGRDTKAALAAFVGAMK
jgi:hypothetical protein